MHTATKNLLEELFHTLEREMVEKEETLVLHWYTIMG